MNELQRWMAETGETDQTLAPKIGISRVHTSRLRRGICKPRPQLATKISEITGKPAAVFIFDEQHA